MMSSTRMSTASHVFSALAFGAIAMSSLMGNGKTGLTDDDGGGLGIPSLGNGDAPQTCTLTSSDPRNRDSCNSKGGNGKSGDVGYIHGNARHYEDYRDDPDFEDYVDRHR